MKLKRILGVLSLTILVFSSTIIVEASSLKNFCEQNHISYSLVCEVGKYSKDLSNYDIALYFSRCAEHADSESFIEPVDAIVNVLNCSYEEALHILENE